MFICVDVFISIFNVYTFECFKMAPDFKKPPTLNRFMCAYNDRVKDSMPSVNMVLRCCATYEVLTQQPAESLYEGNV